MDSDTQNPLVRTPHEEAEKDVGFEKALQLAGSWGPWQLRLFLLASFSQTFSACHAVVAAFLSATPEYSCQWTDDHSANPQQNSTFTLPVPEFTDTSQCERQMSVLTLSENGDHVSQLYMPCTHWDYSKQIYQSTVVSEWDLVCSRVGLAHSIQVTYMLGILVGCFVFGHISDKFGRRPTMIYCSIVVTLIGIIASFSPNMWIFLVLRSIIALHCAGMMVTNFVLIVESTGPKARTVVGMLNGIPFGLGVTLTAVFAYFIRDWRPLQFSISLSSSLLLIYIWFLKESPRWLATQGRLEESLDILKQIAHTNANVLPADAQMLKYLQQAQPTRPLRTDKGCSRKCVNVLEEQFTLVRTPVMRLRSIISFVMWFTSAMIYYGLIFSGPNVDFDPFYMVMISGLVEVPAFVISAVVLTRVGRRAASCFLFLAAGMVLLTTTLVPKNMVALTLVLVNLGKGFDTSVFQLCYLYTSELAPTSVRNIAVGTSSMFARIGAAIAPYLVSLLGGLHPTAPSVLFGITSILAGILTLLLPETLNKPLPSTLEDVERRKK